jgi:hypothetical protein
MNTSIAANGTKTTKEDTLSGKSFGVTGLYHFNPQGSYSPFVKLGWPMLSISMLPIFIRSSSTRYLIVSLIFPSRPTP